MFHTIKKYASLYVAMFKASFIADLEYRANFFTRILTDVFWYAAQILTFEVLYQHTDKIGDWDVHQMRVFLGLLFVIDALYMIIIHENLENITEKVRKGDLDLLLAKPVNSQFMLTLQKANTAIFGTDYDMVQRMLTARDGKQSARAVLGSGLAEIPIALLFLSIGTLLRAYYQVHPDPQLPSSAKEVFGYFIVTQLPAGLVGLLIAAVISVVLSTYESALTALAGSFVVDFYRPTVRPGRSDEHYLRVTRWTTLGFAILLALVAYHSQQVDEILALARSEETPAGHDRGTALLAIPLSILVVLWVKTHSQLAFPWFVGLGATVGTLVILLYPTKRQHHRVTMETSR